MSEFPQQPIPRSPEPKDQKSLKVLVAEDEPLYTRLLQATLSENPNLHADFFDRGDQTLEQLRRAKEGGNSYDLIICDKGLKDGDVGFAIAQAVMQEGLASYFIFLTGSAEELKGQFTDEQLKVMGVDELWGKPMSPVKLMDKVQERIAAKQQPQS